MGYRPEVQAQLARVRKEISHRATEDTEKTELCAPTAALCTLRFCERLPWARLLPLRQAEAIPRRILEYRLDAIELLRGRRREFHSKRG
jgi:hypothetical protein